MERMIKKDAVGDIRKFGAYMRDGTARSLDLLRSIEDTIAAIHLTNDCLKGFVGLVQRMEATVIGLKSPMPEDVVPVFEAAQDTLAQLHAVLRRKHAAAKRAPDLQPADGVCEAYAETMETLRHVNDCIETLRWLILEHNAEFDTSTAEPMSSVEEIERYLASL